MDPQLLRGNLTLALFIMLLGLFILPFQDPGSAGFVVPLGMWRAADKTIYVADGGGAIRALRP